MFTSVCVCVCAVIVLFQCSLWIDKLWNLLVHLLLITCLLTRTLSKDTICLIGKGHAEHNNGTSTHLMYVHKHTETHK